MPLEVPGSPEYAQLAGKAIGRPVKTAHAIHMIREVAWLLGRQSRPIFSQVFRSTTVSKVVVAYCRAPGTQVLLVEAELQKGSSEGGSLCAVSVSSGSVSVLGGGSFLDGVTVFDTTSLQRVSHDKATAFLDVTGLPVATTVYLTFTRTTDKGGGSGFYRLHVHEMPIASASPVESPTTEIGLSPAWPQALNPMTQGGANESYGFVRLFSQIDNARRLVKRHVQFACHEAASSSDWDVTSTSAGAAFPFGTGTNPTFKLRARNLYGTSNAYELGVRYYAPTVAGTLRIAVTALGSGVTTNTSIPLPVNGAFGNATPVAVTLPCTGTDAELTFTLHAWNAGAGSVYVSNVNLIENES